MKERNFDPRIHIGETHGIYTLIDILDEKDEKGQYVYIGKCNECGHKRHSHYANFHSCPVNICTHIRLGANKFIPMVNWENERIARIYHNIKHRCYDERDKSYRWYGAKGIKVCDEWLNNPKSFENWSLQNGYIDGLTIDRINENEDYSPDNCRWIPNVENAKYKSTTSIIDVDGEIHSGKDWSEILGLSTNMINKYIRQYGLDNTIEFIRRYLKNPNLKPINNNCSIYSVYMN